MEEVKYTDYGIASRIGNTIYLNKALLAYPILHKALLKHEHAHSSKFEIRDIILDFKGIHNSSHNSSVKRQYYRFIFAHPKSLTQFLPVWVYDKRLVIDPIMTFIWVLILIMIKFAVWSVR